MEQRRTNGEQRKEEERLVQAGRFRLSSVCTNNTYWQAEKNVRYGDAKKRNEDKSCRTNWTSAEKPIPDIKPIII